LFFFFLGGGGWNAFEGNGLSQCNPAQEERNDSHF
jgi:hypothetical protein